MSSSCSLSRETSWCTANTAITSAAEWATSCDVLHSLVPRKHSKLLLIGGEPKLKERATYCLPARFASTALERCDTPRGQATWESLDAMLRSYAQQHGDVFFFVASQNWFR